LKPVKSKSNKEKKKSPVALKTPQNKSLTEPMKKIDEVLFEIIEK